MLCSKTWVAMSLDRVMNIDQFVSNPAQKRLDPAMISDI